MVTTQRRVHYKDTLALIVFLALSSRLFGEYIEKETKHFYGKAYDMKGNLVFKETFFLQYSEWLLLIIKGSVF